MSRTKLIGAIAVAAALVLALTGPSSSARPAHRAATPICGTLATAPTYKHVIMVLMENHSYGTIIGSPSAPFINGLTHRCGLATNYHNVTHFSLPNYLALTSGLGLSGLSPFTHDCNPAPGCNSGANNIFNQMAAKHGWKSYEETMPSNCSTSNSGFYAPRHNPAVYYTDINNCSTNDVPLGTTSSSPLLTDFSSESTAPSFAFVTPNVCNDMHGATGCPGSDEILAGDNWLRQWLPLITGTAVYKSNDTAVFIVWDEGEPSVAGENCATHGTDQSCHVVAILVAPSVHPAARSNIGFTHYSLLKTTEDLLGVGELGQAKTATSMALAFNL